jgi:glycosyltransferase involved in cell wall biosynthesis
MSVLISHPSVAPFVQQAARALFEAGELDRFITSVRYDPQSAAQRRLCALGRACGLPIEARLKRRIITEIPLSKVESHPWGEIARLLSGFFDRSGRLTDLVWERAEPAFDRLVARRVRADHDAVYGFEYSSLATFTRARELGVRVVYDMPAPEPRFVQKLLETEIDRLPELRTAYHRHTAAREERRIGRRRAEWNSADLVIAASRFTRDSFAQADLDIAKVRVVPYGAPPAIPREEAVNGGSRKDEQLRLIWAGTFSIRKGAHYLLDAWRQGGFGRHAQLKVFGSVTLPDRLLHPPPENVEFVGSLPRSSLMEHYRTSDALIFPTLCDGFGMVVTEAWSRGLPVITTNRAGAADLLQPRQNGLLIPAGDAAAIGGAIDWCLAHRNELHAMREASLATAAGWQWSDYRQSLTSTLRQAGIFRPKAEAAPRV